MRIVQVRSSNLRDKYFIYNSTGLNLLALYEYFIATLRVYIPAVAKYIANDFLICIGLVPYKLFI